MKPFTDEQRCLHRAFWPISPANITSTAADRGRPTTPDLRTAVPLAAQAHSDAVESVPTAAAFSRRVRAALILNRFSFQFASQGNVAVVEPVSTAATSHRIAGGFGEVATGTDAPKRSQR